MTTKRLLTAATTMALAGSTMAAPVVLDGTNNWLNASGTFDASGSDKLVVVISGEHGFGGNNDGINLNGIFYDGVAMTPVIQYEGQPEAGVVNNDSPDQLHHHIYYLDNPASSGGVITIDGNISRFAATAFGLSGTAAGVGNSDLTVGGTSVDLSASVDSMVIAAIGVGGDGNTANVGSIDADAPLTEQSAIAERNWNGHVTGTEVKTSSGSQTYSFTGAASPDFSNTFAVEFTAIPEPSSLALLGLGGLLIARRRRG